MRCLTKDDLGWNMLSACTTELSSSLKLMRLCVFIYLTIVASIECALFYSTFSFFVVDPSSSSAGMGKLSRNRLLLNAVFRMNLS